MGGCVVDADVRAGSREGPGRIGAEVVEQQRQDRLVGEVLLQGVQVIQVSAALEVEPAFGGRSRSLLVDHALERARLAPDRRD